MNKTILLAMLALATPNLAACGEDDHEPAPAQAAPDMIKDLQDLYDEALTEARDLRDPESGWLVHDDCDAALWTGKYGAVTGAEIVDWTAAEYPGEPGRFARRPLTAPCVQTNPLSSSWSRDMGKGLLAYAWRRGDRALIERHASYGNAHHWQMGEPLGDARSVYTPSMIGQVYQTIFALGGTDNVNRLWPDMYPTGLNDYEAHLQVMNIWHRGEVAEALREGIKPNETPVVDEGGPAPELVGQLALLDVSDVMLDRLREHAGREPENPFYAAELAVYTGDYGVALDLLRRADKPVGSYVRCEHQQRACQLAEWLFAADIVLRRFPKQAPTDDQK